jgi:hypothetical protein
VCENANFLTYFPNFGKNKSRPMWSPCCLCVWVPPLSTFECLNQFLMKLYVRNDTGAHLNGVLHKSQPSVCVFVCVSLLIVARQRFGDTFLWQRIHATIEELLEASFSIQFVSYEKKSVGLSVNPPIVARHLLVNTIPRQRRFLSVPCPIRGK